MIKVEPVTSAEEWVRLRSSDDMDEQHRAAWAEAPLEMWLEVIDRFPDMREWVALNKYVPSEVLSVLMLDPDPRVRHFVALRRKLTRPQFEWLAKDADSSIRRMIACNPKTPADVLQKLCADSCDLVRDAAKDRLLRS